MTKTFTITYSFTLPDKQKVAFQLLFDAERIELINSTDAGPPFWTRLDYEQCPHCPYTLQTHSHCPVALNLVRVIDCFDRIMSFEKIVVEVSLSERCVVQETSAQEGLSSLMGLLIAGSSCPLTHFFKPMARFHLPFASKEETIWRAAATFLLARFFSQESLPSADLQLRGLVRIYNDVARLNDALVARLRAATKRDSTVNALVHLDVFAKFLTPPLDDSLMQIRPIFDPLIVNTDRGCIKN
jgi:hypothetical protein